MSDPVASFLRYTEHDRGHSPHTIARYRSVLAKLSETVDPIDATVEDIQTWWESRYGLSAATRGNELACLRSFYKWVTRFDLRPDDPTRRLDLPKVPIRVPKPIGKADLDRLLGPLTDDALDLRRAVALGVYAGMRVSEAAALDWSTVNLERRVIYTIGKGDKERTVPLSPILWDYIAPEVAGNVVTAGQRPMSGPVLQRKINRLLARHGIHHTFHDLRKRGATLALARGGNPEAVRKVFGWASMDTVSHYADVGTDEIHKIGELMI